MVIVANSVTPNKDAWMFNKIYEEKTWACLRDDKQTIRREYKGVVTPPNIQLKLAMGEDNSLLLFQWLCR